jgi:hypothetical protein
MDLPPDKIRILRDVDLSKKWELVRNQRQVDTAVAVTSPSEYLEKLLVYIDVKKNAKKVCIMAY